MNELIAAQEEQNRAIEAAQAAYAEAINQSRERLSAAMQARFRVWNGEPDPELPRVAAARVVITDNLVRAVAESTEA